VLFGDVEDPSLPIIPLGVGKDVVVAQLVAAVMGVTGVYRVVVDQPAADVVIAANEFPELGAVTVTMEAPTDE
jgi:phage-related baseplate assembly protein